LDVFAPDPVLFILGRHHVAIQNRDGNDIGQAVIRLLLRSNRIRLIALFSAADDIEGHVERFYTDTLHIRRTKMVALFKIQHSLDRRL
jgi:hypothetical protein